RDGHSNALFEIVRAIEGGRIHAGASAPFQIRVENPPADAVDLEATFAAYGEPVTPEHPVAPAAGSSATLEAPLVLGPAQEMDASSQALSANEGARGPIDGLAPRFSADADHQG
ncbi:MAG: hypothetical protein AB7L65_03305, partial [Hyphomonadaceae bacterium]